MFSRRDCSAELPLEPLWRLPSLETTYRGKLFFFHISVPFPLTLAPLSGNFIGTKERPRNTPTTTKRGHFQVWWWLYTHLSANATQSQCSCSVLVPWVALLSEAWENSNKFMKLKLFALFFFVSLKHSPPPSPLQHVSIHSALTSLPWVLREMCILENKQIITCAKQNVGFYPQGMDLPYSPSVLENKSAVYVQIVRFIRSKVWKFRTYDPSRSVLISVNSDSAYPLTISNFFFVLFCFEVFRWQIMLE